MKTIVAVCVSQGKLGAILKLNAQDITYDVYDLVVEKDVARFVESLTKKSPQLLSDVLDEAHGTVVLAAKEVKWGDPLYAEAVAQELRHRGFIAAAVSEAQKELLILLNGFLTADQWRDCIWDVFGMSDTDATALVSSIKQGVSVAEKLQVLKK